MPGFTTHYIFGVKAYQGLLPSPLKTAIKQHRRAYSLGQQGPDPFFFHLPSYIRKAGNPANYMHNEDLGLMLKTMLGFLYQNPKLADFPLLLAFTAGFLGHYELDSAVHPYIYAMSDPEATHAMKTLSLHFALENELDSILCRRFMGRRLNNFKMHKVVRITMKESLPIAELLKFSANKVYPDMKASSLLFQNAFSTEQFWAWVLEDKSGLKKKLIRRIEKLILGYPVYSGIIGSENLYPSMDDPFNLNHRTWVNPWEHTIESSASMIELTKAALFRYREELALINKLYFMDVERERFLRQLFRLIENKSLHSGLSPAP